jgi:hypothetical protein
LGPARRLRGLAIDRLCVKSPSLSRFSAIADASMTPLSK